MSEFWQDVRYGLRMLRKSPWVTGIAVLALALGIGANTAIFSVVYGLLLQPLPFPAAERLMQIEQRNGDEYDPTFSISKFFSLRQEDRGFEALTAYEGLSHGYSLIGDGRPQRVVGTGVTWEFFRVLGVNPALGRGFTQQDDLPGAGRSVVLSHRLWQQRFGGDRAAVGRKLVLDGEPYEVIGVMPPGFQYPATAELWTPLRLDPASQDRARFLLFTGRLKPGISPDAARAEMDARNREYLVRQGWGDSREAISVRPLQVYLHGEFRPALLVMLAAVALVLLIACADVANLQLARFAARHREIAIRSTLGARSVRIVRQLLTESVLLALAGGALGVLICYASVKPLLALAPASLASRLPPIEIDGAVLAFAAGLSLLTGLLSGAVPAFQTRRVDLNGTIKEGSTGSGAGGGRQGRRVRYSLVVAEVALTIVLMIGAGLLIKSFNGLRGIDPGFDPQGVLTMKIPLPEAKYGPTPALENLQRLLLPELEALPGVSAAAASTNLPFEPGAEMTFVIDGRYTGGSEGKGVSHYRGVTPRFFDALKIPLLRGRAFRETDGGGAPGVMILNETAALRFFPAENPIGQRITIGLPDMPEQADPAPREIIGIVADVREDGLDKATPPIFYVPMAQIPPTFNALLVQVLPLNLVVRAAGDPRSLARTVEEKVWAYDGELPVTEPLPLEEVLSRSLGLQRFRVWLLGSLAVLALILSAVGVYGVLSHLVGQRTREIGIRVALGGRPGDVVRLVMRQGMVPVLIGIAIGVAGALASMHLLASFLFGVEATDFFTFATVAAFLTLVALVAIYLPARRAARVSPVEALRYD